MANAFMEQQQRQREEALMEKCQELIAAGKLIDAIKAYRAGTGCGLDTARRALRLR
ncbi:TPA: hypothetical protein L4559_003532 [Pseudomonas aeruginosa]|nr:hypothetical protein [Pseudomonas aeruginosa]